MCNLHFSWFYHTWPRNPPRIPHPKSAGASLPGDSLPVHRPEADASQRAGGLRCPVAVGRVGLGHCPWQRDAGAEDVFLGVEAQWIGYA